MSNSLVMSQERQKKEKDKKNRIWGPVLVTQPLCPPPSPSAKLSRSPLRLGERSTEQDHGQSGQWKAGGLIKQYLLNTRAWGRSPVQSTHWRQMSTMPHQQNGAIKTQGKHSIMVASFQLPPPSPCVQHS